MSRKAIITKNKVSVPSWSDITTAYGANDLQLVETFCHKILKHNPNHAPSWQMLGVCALSKKEYKSAYTSFARAADIDVNNASYYNNLGVAARNCSLLPEAETAYRNALRLQPDYPDAWFNLGNVLRERGESEQSVSAYRKAVELKPDYQSAWNNLGNTFRQLGRPDDAVEAFRKALSLKDDAQTRSNLAFALRESGQKDSSLDVQRQSVVTEPDNPALHFNLANALRDADLTDESIDHYRHALVLKPDYAGAANNLGSVLLHKGEALAALECYRRAGYFEPKNSDYPANEANAERALKRYDRCISALKRALALQPDSAAYTYNLANYLREWQQQDISSGVTQDEIETVYRRAIELQPNFADAWNNLAGFYSDNGRDEPAIEAYLKAIELAPDNWQYHFSIAQRYHSSGDVVAACASFRDGLAIKPHNGARIRLDTMFPAVMESEEAVRETREQLLERLNNLAGEGLTIADPMKDISVAPMFYLAYHGECNVDLMRAYTGLIRSACPDLEYVAPHCREKKPRSGKIRIGFASKFFQAHTIGRFFRGILKNLNTELFEIYAFMSPTKQDDVTRWIKEHVTVFEMLPASLAEAREHIASYELDILVYADIGMEPFTYYLAFSRLAPVQCVLYGHPDTTGIPAIDYFLSGGACESDAADSHYTEKLVRLDPASTYTYYYRPDNRSTHKIRADYGLPIDNNLYTCAQSMFKIHPEMDPVFDEILERDPNGKLLLFDDVSIRRINLFKQRLKKRMKHYDRVIFLSRIQLPDFLQILHLSDALLDSFHFCGGNTSFDSFAAESPVVTLPGEFMRGRQTMGLYSRMGYMELVAADKSDYVAKVLRLGMDAEYRSVVRRELAAKVSVIYEDPGIVRALEKFFVEVAS